MLCSKTKQAKSKNSQAKLCSLIQRQNFEPEFKIIFLVWFLDVKLWKSIFSKNDFLCNDKMLWLMLRYDPSQNTTIQCQTLQYNMLWHQNMMCYNTMHILLYNKIWYTTIWYTKLQYTTQNNDTLRYHTRHHNIRQFRSTSLHIG